jgi:hypothetical protein
VRFLKVTNCVVLTAQTPCVTEYLEARWASVWPAMGRRGASKRIILFRNPFESDETKLLAAVTAVSGPLCAVQGVMHECAK